MSAVLQRKVDGAGPGAVEVLAVEDNGGTESASWQIVESVGKGPVYTKDVGVRIPVLKERKRKSFSRMLRRKSRKGCKANGNRNLLPRKIWIKLEDVHTQTALPK